LKNSARVPVVVYSEDLFEKKIHKIFIKDFFLSIKVDVMLGKLLLQSSGAELSMGL
jgi:hypothetical protein